MLFLADWLLCSRLPHRQEELGAAERLLLGGRRWLVSLVPAGGDEQLLLAGSGQLDGDRGPTTRVCPMVDVKSPQPRGRDGGLPSLADWMGNNDPLFIASSIVPENPF